MATESPIAGRDWDRPGPYPDPSVEVLDPRFAAIKLNNAAVERLFTGARWAEGPVWFGDHGCLLFSEIPNNPNPPLRCRRRRRERVPPTLQQQQRALP